MGDKLDPEDKAEVFHLGGDLCIGTTAVSYDHAGVVDGAPRTTPLHEEEGFAEKDLGLEAGEGGVVLDEDLSGVGKHETGTLGLEFSSAQFHRMGRGVVLCLCPRLKRIGSRSLFPCLLPQVEIPDDPGKRTVGDVLSMGIAQNLLDPDGIAFTKLKGFLDQGSQVFVVGRSWRSWLSLAPKYPSDRVSGHPQNPADFPDPDFLLL